MTKRSDAEPFEGFDLIHSYSRQQAIEDGVLVDVTATAREAGFRYPVALTATVFGAYVHQFFYPFRQIWARLTTGRWQLPAG